MGANEENETGGLYETFDPAEGGETAEDREVVIAHDKVMKRLVMDTCYEEKDRCHVEQSGADDS